MSGVKALGEVQQYM